MPCRSIAAVLAAVLCTAVPFAVGAASAPGTTGAFQRVVMPGLEAAKPVAADPSPVGYLFMPAGAGPFPAVILMHGCDGLDWNTPSRVGWTLMRRYAERYVAHGYEALILDSFAPRHIGNICGEPLRVTPQQRAWDAFSAAHYLVTAAHADPARLVLQGDSHGAWSILVALQRGPTSRPEPIAAAIAWYPSCGSANSFRRGFLAPLLILIGEADDWTPAGPCHALADRLARAGDGPELVLQSFPGATHAFDFPLGPRTNRLGHRMQYDPQATEASWRLIDSFLAVHVAPAP